MNLHPPSTLRRWLRPLAGAALCLAAAAPAQADTTAATDDKSVDVPTSWYGYTGRTPEQINTLLGNLSTRLTDIEPYDSGSRFTVTMVRNSGAYAVPGWWWYYGLTATQVGETLSANGARLIDIEPYATPSGIRFAVIMVANSGASARAWSWLVGASAAQVNSHVANSGHRLTDFKSYLEGGVRKYVVVGVANTGGDAKAWQYYYGQTSAQVGSRVNAFGGRLTSLERRSDGLFDMVQVKNSSPDSHYWRYYFGLTSMQQVLDVAGQFGSRAFDVETYVSSGVRRYNALLIDNANTETRRIRTAFGTALLTPSGLPNGQWGAYLKRVGGSSTVSLNGGRRFEPASAIKAVHNLATMLRIQSGPLTLGSPLTYYTYPSDSNWDSGYGAPKGQTPNACPDPVDETTANDVASTVNFGKDNMMSASDNRTTRAITLMFATDASNKGPSGIAALEAIAVNQAQMTSTFIDQDRIGCAYVNGKRNQTTLADLGRLYERVENGTLLGTGVHRTEFFEPMNGGAFGTSNQTENDIRQVVAQEGASLGKTADEVSDFIARMDWRFKPGGYGFGCDNAFTPCSAGYITIGSQAGRLTLAAKGGRAGYLLRDYVFGNYAADVNTCDPSLPSSDSASCGACPSCDTQATINATMRNVRRELFRSIIRENLSTY